MASHEPHRAHKLAVGGAVQGRSARKTAAEAAKIAEKARKTDELRRAIGDKLYGTLESMCGAKAFQLFDKDGDGTSLYCCCDPHPTQFTRPPSFFLRLRCDR